MDMDTDMDIHVTTYMCACTCTCQTASIPCRAPTHVTSRPTHRTARGLTKWRGRRGLGQDAQGAAAACGDPCGDPSLQVERHRLARGAPCPLAVQAAAGGAASGGAGLAAGLRHVHGGARPARVASAVTRRRRTPTLPTPSHGGARECSG
eukprot:7237176-Prymnesium_polylepis.1